MTANIIDGKRIAQTIREELRDSISQLVEAGHRQPCLAVVLVGDDPASHVYVSHKKKACQAVGIASRSIELPADTSQEALNEHLKSLNSDADVDGILLQLPLPKHLSPDESIDLIHPEKDVDGLTPYNQGLLVWRRPHLVSCTPAGIMELLNRSQVELLSKEAVGLGRSVLVGAPIATLLSNAGATVQSLHSKSLDTAEHCRRADVLVVATGVRHLVKKEWIKPGAVVIDVGIHRGETGLEGDVDFDGAKDVAGAITPVPGGVGPMTIAMLLKNCFLAYKDRMGR